MGYNFRCVVLALCSLVTCIGEISTAGERDSTQTAIEFAPGLRSVQLDGTVFLFNYAYSGSVDIDLLQFKTGRRSSIGIRAGVERFSTGGPGGQTGGSPYLDYNALLRSTLTGEAFRFDAFVGYAQHTSDHPQFYPAKGLVKYGAELRWKIAPGVFGLLLKANGTSSDGIVGIGLYFGWDQ